jgi:hypothetical protein
MYTEIFKPVLFNYHRCNVEEVKHSIQKEARIIDSLEPVMNQHRLIFDRAEVDRDYEDSKEEPRRQLFYQMTRLTRDRGSLQYDDRIDVLAMGVKYWWEQMAADENQAYVDRKQEDFLEGVNNFMNQTKGQETERMVWNQVR